VLALYSGMIELSIPSPSYFLVEEIAYLSWTIIDPGFVIIGLIGLLLVIPSKAESRLLFAYLEEAFELNWFLRLPGYIVVLWRVLALPDLI